MTLSVGQGTTVQLLGNRLHIADWRRRRKLTDRPELLNYDPTCFSHVCTLHGRLGEKGRRQVGAGPWLELVFSDSLGTDNILGLRQPGSNYKNTSYLSI